MILLFCDFFLTFYLRRLMYKQKNFEKKTYFCQCCGSGMFIPDPGSWFLPIPDLRSPIPDPKTGRKERGEKKSSVKHFFVATNFPKCKIILFLNCSRKKFEPNFKELWNFLPKKLSISSQKYEFGIRDPRSGIQESKGTQSRIPDPDPQHWFLLASCQPLA